MIQRRAWTRLQVFVLCGAIAAAGASISGVTTRIRDGGELAR
jgi:hypothetical protein